MPQQLPLRRGVLRWKMRQLSTPQNPDPLSDVGIVAKPDEDDVLKQGGIVDSPISLPDVNQYQDGSRYAFRNRNIPPDTLGEANEYASLPPIGVDGMGFPSPTNRGQVDTNVSAGGRVFPEAGTWPVQTIANQDTILPFRIPINHGIVQNNTANPIFLDFDSAASLGSIQIPAGGVFFFDAKVRSVHIFTTVASNVAGSASGGIYVAGFV